MHQRFELNQSKPQMHLGQSLRLSCTVLVLLLIGSIPSRGEDAVSIIFTRDEVQLPSICGDARPAGDLNSHPYEIVKISAIVTFSDTDIPQATRFYKLEWKFIPDNGPEEVYDTAATNPYFRVKRSPAKQTACWPITKRIFLAQPGKHQLRVLTDSGTEVALATFAVKP